MLFMLVETFDRSQIKPLYRRIRDEGRKLPDGLKYIDSWIEASFTRCFQLMECDDITLLQRWVVEMGDAVDFEIVPVAHSKDVRKMIEPLL